MFQPRNRRALLLAQRGVLQGFQRGQTAALFLGLLAHVGQLGLRGALLVLQFQHALLARVELSGQRVERGFLLVMFRLEAGKCLGQRSQVERGPFAGQLFASTLRFEGLAIEIIHASALDVAGARGFGLLARMGVVALLPVGERGLGIAQGILAHAIIGLQSGQLRFGFGNRCAQHVQARLVTLDVLAQLAERRLCLVTRTLQALGHLALVGDLLFDAGEVAADFVAFRLRLVERLDGVLTAHATGLDLALGFTLFGDQLLQPGFFLRQSFTQRLQLRIQATVFQRLPLRVLDPALGLDRRVLLGLACLALEMFELLADFVAQVGQAFEVLAGVADAGFGFLAAFLVLGDAGSFLQVHAQVFGPRIDDLADHALLDDRVAARTKAGPQEQIGDVATAATPAVEVIVAGAVAADAALDRDLVEGGVLAGDGVVGIVEDQFDRRLRHRLARRRTGEDHVGQGIAAQAAGGAFAHHPAHRIDDVGLAAAVRADHTGHVGRQVQRGGIDEGLETGELDRGQAHAVVGCLGSSRTDPDAAYLDEKMVLMKLPSH